MAFPLRRPELFCRIRVLAMLSGILAAVLCHAAKPSEIRKILFVSSCGSACQRSEAHQDGFRDYFLSHTIPVQFDTMELNSELQPDLRPAPADVETIARQLSCKDYALIVADGNAAADIFLDHAIELPQDTPLVFLGYMEYPAGDPRLHQKHVTGLTEPDCIIDNIRLGLELLPDTRVVAVITDGGAGGEKTMQAAQAGLRNLTQQVEIRHLNGTEYSTGEMLKAVARLPEKSFIVFDNWVSRRRELRDSRERVLEKLSHAGDFPIFGSLDYATQAPFIGGIGAPAYRHGQDAAKLAYRILSGEAPENIPVAAGSSSGSFRYPLLEQYGIDPGALPEGVELLEVPPGKWSRCLLGLSIGGGVGVVMLMMLTVFLLAQHRVSRRDEAIYRALPLSILVFDRYGRILFRQKSGEAAAKKCGNLEDLALPEQQPLRRMLAAVFRGGSAGCFEYDADKIRWRGVISQLPDEIFRQPAALLVCLDITELHRTQLALQSAMRRAEKANKAKSTFLATVSHELRTPLNAIIGFSELLQQQELPKEERQDALHAINVAGNALLNLINDVLDLSKIEAGEMQIGNQDVDLRELFGEMQAIFRQKTEKKQLNFVTELDESFPILHSDPLRLRQILLNLVGNALKFTEAGSVTLSARFLPETPTLGTLELSVTDTGIGISADQLERIFDPFRQQDAMRDSMVYHGTGLGLAIVRKLAERLGGAISVNSRENEGSEFTLRLSKVYYHPRDEKSVAAEPEEDDEHFDGIPVLIVDDVPMNLKVFGAMLRRLGVSYHTASSGAEALLILEQNPQIALVLSDLWMPGMDGVELAKTIRRQPRWAKVGIAAVTADAEYTDADGTFDAILYKPITDASLRALFGKFRPRQ